MAKDAKGHGSDAHSSGVQQVGKQSVELMSKAQLDQLRTQFSGIKTIDPSLPAYGKLTAFLSDTHPDRLKQMADAGIPFLSNLARNRLPDTDKYQGKGQGGAARFSGMMGANTSTHNSSGHEWGSPAALEDFKREHGGPRDHAAEQRGFNSGKREIARLRRQGK